ncbi:Ctr copper transporter [Trinorchestia longiramus]|nr:Ctr copper transporter [Trinorchestia longiramus]
MYTMYVISKIITEMNYFYFGYTFHNFILKGVDIVSVSGFLCLCLGVAFLCIGNEGLRVVRAHLARCTPSAQSAANPGFCLVAQSSQSLPPETRKPIMTVEKILDDTETKSHSHCNSRPVLLIFQSLIHVCYVAVGYTIMLVVMTFNAYLMFVAILGVGIGYFLFGTFNLMLMEKINPYLLDQNCGGIAKLGKVVPSLSDSPQDFIDHTNACRNPCISNDAGSMQDPGPAIDANDTLTESEIYIIGTPETDRQLLMTSADDMNSEEHRTSDIAALLRQEVTVDIHV